MNRLWISFFCFIFTALLNGCTSVAPPSTAPQKPWKNRQVALNHIQSWQLSGKIAILTARNTGSATVDWKQNRQRFTISLFGPLGTTGLKLSGQPGTVLLETADGKHFRANNPEELLAQQWGWNLPVSHLNYWIRGLPVPGIPDKSEFDTSQRLIRLSQANWDIQFLSYTSAEEAGQGLVDLPSKISITSPSLKTKIIVYNWKIL